MVATEQRAWNGQYAPWTNPAPNVGSDTIVSLFNQSVATQPNRPATWFMGKTLTYAQLNVQVSRCAAALSKLGVEEGDRVAVALPNCPQHVIAITAILRLGATVVEHNPLYTAAELEPQILDHGARVAIVFDRSAETFLRLADRTSLETVVAVNLIEAMPWHVRVALAMPLPQTRKQREKLTGTPVPEVVTWEKFLASADHARQTAFPLVTQEHTAFILYTSGTSGAPKGAPLTHHNIIAVIRAGLEWMGDWGAVEERVLAILPLFHIYGVTLNYVLPLTTAAQMVLVPAPEPKIYQKAILKTRPTLLPGVPTLYAKIADWAIETGADLTSIHTSFSGASTLPAPLLERWEQVTGGRLIEGYGLTETAPLLTGNPLDGRRRPGYVGLPFPNTEIRIANPNNPDETMPDGEPGELLARGPQVFAGYLNNQEANQRAFHNGWFRTGDMAVMEPDGWIRLVSRIKEMIITGGFNVYPDEVEGVLREHPDIEDIAVVGRPRPDGSEDVVACITLVHGAELNPAGLKEYARERLTRYKVPRDFYHFDQLNRDQTGKIRRREVRDILLGLLTQP